MPQTCGDLSSARRRKFARLAGGIEEEFVQDNHSKSKRGTLRGLHAQAKSDTPRGKQFGSIPDGLLGRDVGQGGGA